MAEHFCTMHKTVFFMRGNMRGYAHPIGEKDEATDKYPEGWCNEEDLEKVRNLPAQSPDKVLPEHQEEIDKAKKAVTPPAPQELGMFWKELGLRIGDGSIEKDFPKSFTRIKTTYYKKMSEVLGMQFWKEQNKTD